VLFVALDVRQVLTGPSAEAAAALKADVLRLVHTLETLSMPAPPALAPAAAAAATAAATAARSKLTPGSTPSAATSSATSAVTSASMSALGSSSSSTLSAQQRKVARFYAAELTRLCLPAAGDSGPLAGPLVGLTASHFHSRFQDALSSVLRFELKRLLNVCWCEHDAAAVQQQQQRERERAQRSAASAGGDSAADSEEDDEADVAPCSRVLVDDTTGTLQFNAEDPAALLSLALQFMHPVAPLAAVLLHGSSASSASLGSGSGSGCTEPDAEVQELDRVLQQCWSSEQWTPQDEDACMAAVRARVRSLRSSSNNITATATVSTDTTAGFGSRGADGSSIGVLAAAAAAAAAATAAEEECLPLEDIDDLLAYTAGHCYLQYVFSQPPVLCAVAAGHWAHVSELARESSVFTDNNNNNNSSSSSSALDSSSGLYTSLLSDVPALAQSCLQDSRAVRRLRGALVVERRLATRRVYTSTTHSSDSNSSSSGSSGSGHNSRKRLRCRVGDSPAATTAAAAAVVDCSGRGTLQFPEVVTGCRLLMTEDEAAFMGWH
jgi:hypothetical protein